MPLPLITLLCLLCCSECFAGYTIVTRQQVSPKFILVMGVGKMEQALNPGPIPAYPATVKQLAYRPPDFDLYSSDADKRKELWLDDYGIASESEILATFPRVLDAKYQRLWEAASAWERQYISGVGLSILSLGVAKGKPKSMAVAGWSNRLWMEVYYPRKATVRLDAEPDYDFSVAGPMPYSAPELSAEVWAP